VMERYEAERGSVHGDSRRGCIKGTTAHHAMTPMGVSMAVTAVAASKVAAVEMFR